MIGKIKPRLGNQGLRNLILVNNNHLQSNADFPITDIKFPSIFPRSVN